MPDSGKPSFAKTKLPKKVRYTTLARAPDANPEPDGDATDFAREDYVEAAWRVVDPVLGITLATDPRDIIQPAMARPISSGESSWTKWTPATVTSVCAGKLQVKSRTAPWARIPPGSAFKNSFGTLLVASQSA